MWWKPITGSGDIAAQDAPQLELPTLALSEWEVAAFDPTVEMVSAAESLAEAFLRLGHKARLVVRGDSWHFGELLRVVGTMCPEALTGLSLSTFEGTPPFPFRVIGSPGTRPGYEPYVLDEEHLVGAEFHETFTRLSDQSPASDLLVQASGAAVEQLAGDDRRASFRLTARRIIDASIGKLEIAELPQVIRLPGAVQYIALEEPGLAAIAELLVDGDTAVAVALRQAQPPLSRVVVGRLCECVTARYEAGSPLRGCGPTISLLSGLSPEDGEGVAASALRAALESPLDAKLMSGDVAVLLASAAQGGVEVATLEPLIRYAAQSSELFLSDSRLPLPYLIAIFRAALAEDPLRGDVLGKFLVERLPEVCAESLTGDECDRCIDLLGAMDAPELTPLLGRSVAIIGRASNCDRAVAMVRRLDAKGVVQSMLSGPLPLEPTLAPFVRRYAGELISDDLDSGKALNGFQSAGLALQLLKSVEDPDCFVARRIVLKLREMTAVATLEATEAAAEITDVDLRRVIARYSRLVSVAAIRSRSDASQLCQRLLEDSPDDVYGLFDLLRDASRTPSAASHVLFWVATQKVSIQPELIRRGGILHEGEGTALVAEVAQRADPNAFLEYEQDIEDAPRQVRHWWRQLTAVNAPKKPLRTRVGLGERHGKD